MPQLLTKSVVFVIFRNNHPDEILYLVGPGPLVGSGFFLPETK